MALKGKRRKLRSSLWIVLAVVAVIAVVAGVSFLPLSLLGQTHLSMGLSPASNAYALGQQVTVAGVLTCSGSGCPPNTMYGMLVELSGSWGWTATATTNNAGAYSTSVTLPSTSGIYMINALFDGAGEVSDSHAAVSVTVGTPLTTTSTGTSATGSTTVTKTTSTTSTGTSTSTEYSTSHTTTTITSGSGTTTTPNLSGAEDWLKSKTTLGGYDIPNWYFIVGFVVVVALIWWWRRNG
jgi:hypothetical protein